jgi:hypothetical protein
MHCQICGAPCYGAIPSQALCPRCKGLTPEQRATVSAERHGHRSQPPAPRVPVPVATPEVNGTSSAPEAPEAPIPTAPRVPVPVATPEVNGASSAPEAPEAPIPTAGPVVPPSV